MGRALLTGLVVCSAFYAEAATAQTSENASTDQTSSDPALEEIIVTAQRRGENLQDVPISVTALTASSLERQGVLATQDLTMTVPGLTFARSTYNAQPTIRGIGTRDTATGAESSVAIFVDGVYQAQVNGNVFELSDVERIEVLRGPQGTLYGRNSMGGAISIVTQAPTFTPTVKLSGSYGSYNHRSAKLFASGPVLGDNLAIAIAASTSKEDGYVRNIYLDRMVGGGFSTNLAFKALYVPTDQVKLALNLRYNRSDVSSSIASQPLNAQGGYENPNTFIRTAVLPAGLTLAQILPNDYNQTAGEVVPFHKMDSKSADLHGDFDLSFARLSTLVSYRHVEFVTTYDNDQAPIGNRAVVLRPEGDTWYIESTLASKNKGPVEWIIGGTVFLDDSKALPWYVPPNRTDFGVKSDAYAAFAEVSYKGFERLTLTAGLRYSWEKKFAFNANQALTSNPSGSTKGQVPLSYVEAERAWSSFNPRAVARYEFAPGSSVYLSYSTGFKSGFFNASAPSGLSQPVRPEQIRATELGFKSDLASNLRVNASLFKYKYTDLQVQTRRIINGSEVGVTENAGSADIWGAEVEASWKPIDGLELHGTLAKLDTKFGSFPNASVLIPRIVNGVTSGNITVSRDVTGNRLIRSPEFTVTLSATYTAPLFGGEFSTTVNAFRSTKVYYDVLNSLYQPDYAIANASATWRSPKGYYATASVRNLTSKNYLIAATAASNLYYGNFAQPRTFMLTLGYDFK